MGGSLPAQREGELEREPTQRARMSERENPKGAERAQDMGPGRLRSLVEGVVVEGGALAQRVKMRSRPRRASKGVAREAQRAA